MGYVNFKEEKAKAKLQLEKRKANNEKLYSDILKKKDSLTGYYPNLKYSYKKILDQFIGKKGILGEENFYEIKNEDIICTKFIGCKFTNLKFKECRFIGCVFENCNFNGGGVIFENCIFIKKESEKLPSLNRKDNLGCSFCNCNIYAKFLNSDMSFVILENCVLKNSKMELTSVQNLIILNSEINMLEVIDSDFSGFKSINCYIEDFLFNDKYKTKFDEKTFFDKITPRVKDKKEYEGIYMTYEILANKFKENTLDNNFGEYYYLAKYTERKCIGIIPKIEYTLYWLTCGYGERPWFCVLSSLVIILIFSFIYLLAGIDLNGEIIRYSVFNMNTWSLTKFTRDINEAIHISVGMFGGIGCDGAKPIPSTYNISNIEMLIGIVMMGIGIGTLTRKVIR
ncbi:MAG: pentapeptide repeat-containing protein [Fusobacteriaceae bacterium]